MAVLELFPGTEVQWRSDDLVQFLAGPIQGAPDWQAKAIEIFRDKNTIPNRQDIFMANPRRPRMTEDFVYAEQVGWEKKHLKRSAQFGGILVWLAKQDPALEYEEGRAYAQTTRIEFGRVLGWKDINPNVNLSIGIEAGYIGSEKYYLNCAEEIGLEVHDNLEDLCGDALGKLVNAERIEF